MGVLLIPKSKQLIFSILKRTAKWANDSCQLMTGWLRPLRRTRCFFPSWEIFVFGFGFRLVLLSFWDHAFRGKHHEVSLAILSRSAGHTTRHDPAMFSSNVLWLYIGYVYLYVSLRWFSNRNKNIHCISNRKHDSNSKLCSTRKQCINSVNRSWRIFS